MRISTSVRALIRLALKEDIGAAGDITSLATVPPGSISKAAITAKEPLTLAGAPFVKEVFRTLDINIRFRTFFKDGEKAGKDETIAELRGPTRAILAAERTALNILQRMSGIATLTEEYVLKVKGTDAKIYDTRKTAPGLRELDKYAVRMGGGTNHRMGLWDAVLIKDNHIEAAGGIGRAVQLVRSRRPKANVEVEAGTLREVREALKAGADIIMLDNMPLARMKKAVALTGGMAMLEASGNVTLTNVRAIARTGVDMISVGALTHSAPAVDISLDIIG